MRLPGPHYKPGVCFTYFSPYCSFPLRFLVNFAYGARYADSRFVHVGTFITPDVSLVAIIVIF